MSMIIYMAPSKMKSFGFKINTRPFLLLYVCMHVHYQTHAANIDLIINGHSLTSNTNQNVMLTFDHHQTSNSTTQLSSLPMQEKRKS